jgi:hypothetical protein
MMSPAPIDQAIFLIVFGVLMVLAMTARRPD